MEIEIQNLFSTPISVSDFYSQSIDDEIESCISSLKFSTNDYFDTLNTKTSGSVITSNVIEEYQLLNLKQHIINNLRIYSQQVSGCNFNFNIKTSWVTKTPPGHFIQTHHHQSSMISGVYYHEVPENSGDIYFRSNDKMMETSPFFMRAQDYYVRSLKGRMILFPSWIDHGVRSNNSNKDRISISFNIII